MTTWRSSAMAASKLGTAASARRVGRSMARASTPRPTSPSTCGRMLAAVPEAPCARTMDGRVATGGGYAGPGSARNRFMPAACDRRGGTDQRQDRVMTPARLVPLPSPADRAPSIRIEGDRLVVERLVVADHALAGSVASRPEHERPALVERALRIGLLALQDAGVSVDVDVIRREFASLLGQTEAANERAAAALGEMLRANFADGDGRLPRTMERFLGDRGQLRMFVSELFDESKRDSAIGRIRQLLGTYFDGDASRLAQLLDPTRLGSPLHQFRTEVSEGFAKLNERLAAIEAAAAARGGERARAAAKGAD